MSRAPQTREEALELALQGLLAYMPDLWGDEVSGGQLKLLVEAEDVAYAQGLLNPPPAR